MGNKDGVRILPASSAADSEYSLVSISVASGSPSESLRSKSGIALRSSS